MVKLFFYLAILIGVGYAAQRVPVGDRTAVQHLRENVRWESVREAGADAAVAVRGFLDSWNGEPTPATTTDVKSGGPAAAAPAKSDVSTAKTTAADGDRAPAERLTAADRRALEDLLPH